MIDGRNVFDQPIKNDLKAYDNIGKITTVHGDDYIIGCFLVYYYFEKRDKLIANNKNLSKQQKLDADPKAIQQVNFTRNLNREEDATMFLIIDEAKETVLDSSKETAKLFRFNIILTKNNSI